jgi:hypothetical protein
MTGLRQAYAQHAVCAQDARPQLHGFARPRNRVAIPTCHVMGGRRARKDKGVERIARAHAQGLLETHHCLV